MTNNQVIYKVFIKNQYLRSILDTSDVFAIHTDAFSVGSVFETLRFQMSPLWTPFSNVCVLDENAQCFSVNDRRKRIEKYAFSNENASVWTGP